MEIVNDVLELIGDTPMVRLNRMTEGLAPQVVAKLEYFNPGGSAKDRIAVGMIEAAEKAGLLKPGGTIVEPTSGNTGVGLAIVASRKGYKCIFVCPDKVAPEKISQLRAYGAEVHVCPTAVEPDDPQSYYSVSDRLVREIPGAYKPDQYSNPANPAAHYATTGPEIWEQTKGKITHFVAGVGTAGTITGTARYLREKNPDIKIIGADPVGSVYSGGTGRPYLVEGVGEDFWPGNYDASMIDRVIAVEDKDSFNTARRMTLEEGIFIGGSSGMAVYAALELAKELTPDDLVVVLIPDSGRGYLSKVFNDEWMSNYGFLQSSGPTVADLMKQKDGSIPPIVHTHPGETLRQTVEIMREYGVSQLVMLAAEPPVVMGEVRGAVSEEDLLRKAFDNPAVLDEPIENHIGPMMKTIGFGESLTSAIHKLDGERALLVVDQGRPVGVIARSDLLEHLAGE